MSFSLGYSPLLISMIVVIMITSNYLFKFTVTTSTGSLSLRSYSTSPTSSFTKPSSAGGIYPFSSGRSTTPTVLWICSRRFDSR